METLVSCTDSRPSPVFEPEFFVSLELVVAQFTFWGFLCFSGRNADPFLKTGVVNEAQGP